MVNVSPTSVTIDVPRVELRELESWQFGIAAVGQLSIHPVASDSDLASRLYDHVAADPAAAQQSIFGDYETWSQDASGKTHRDKFIVGPLAAVPTYLSKLAR